MHGLDISVQGCRETTYFADKFAVAHPFVDIKFRKFCDVIDYVCNS